MPLLLCQCSSSSIQLDRLAPPKLGNAAPRPGAGVEIYTEGDNLGFVYGKIFNSLKEWGAFRLDGESSVDYVVSIRKTYPPMADVSIYYGYLPDRETLENGVNLDSRMNKLASESFTAGLPGQLFMKSWVMSQLVPSKHYYDFPVDFSGKKDMEMVARCIRRHEWADAQNLINDLLTEYPNDAEVIYMSGIVLLGRDEFEQAENAFHKAYSIKPEQKYLTAVTHCRTIAVESAQVKPFLP